TITTIASSATPDTAMMIFFLRVNAMFSSLVRGLKFFNEYEVVAFSRETDTLEVASTSKLIKLFQLTANKDCI
ncbi:MAG TPA: hypothetical protein VJ372_01915, partial [Pyrinomonadaceae bacterium]|nr:hypothetical protein [Pyrinomonadaceae bacterium]